VTIDGAGRVLVVDDEADMREALSDLLRRSGFEIVGTASNGQEAVARNTELHPELVLMDMRMPEMDGIEATRRIKAMTPDTQVLILSAYEELDLQEAASDAGIYCYLVKGTDPAMIVDMLGRAKAFAEGIRSSWMASGRSTGHRPTA
jgi:two-component system, chemotaxis family, chemotaxis protein CheY